MARNLKWGINIDKCRICFKQPQDLFERLYNSKNNLIDLGDGYSLYICREEEEKGEEIPTNLIVNVLLSHWEENFLFGHFNFTNSKKYEGLCWLTMENKSLYYYHSLGYFTFVSVIYTLMNALGLEYNNITELELALDTTKNMVKATRQLIKDHRNIEMVYNGKIITDPSKRLPFYGVHYGSSRIKLLSAPTLYFRQTKDNAPKMKIYSKSVEIEEERGKKDYITQWNDFGKMPIYRVEITLKNESLKEVWEKYGNLHFPPRGEQDKHHAPNLLNMLDDPFTLEWLWREFSNRILTFNTSQGEKITLFDLATR